MIFFGANATSTAQLPQGKVCNMWIVYFLQTNIRSHYACIYKMKSQIRCAKVLKRGYCSLRFLEEMFIKLDNLVQEINFNFYTICGRLLPLPPFFLRNSTYNDWMCHMHSTTVLLDIIITKSWFLALVVVQCAQFPDT